MLRATVAAPVRARSPTGATIRCAVLRRDGRAVRWGAAGAALLAVAVYANSLTGGLVYDDRTVIITNEAAHHPLVWRDILLGPSWSPTGTIIAYRPLATWTFALDWAAHGERAFGYHLLNVLAHAAVTALVVLLAATLGSPARAAMLAGLLFAVHPVHTEAVAGVVGRADVLAAGLSLAALYWQRRAAGHGWPVFASAAAVAAFALALLAKEQAVALGALMPAADLIFTDGGSPARFVRRLRGRRALFYAALTAVGVGYLALRAAALGRLTVDPQTIPFWANPAAGAPRAAQMLTALAVQARALGLLLVPLRLSADYSYRQIPIVDSPLSAGATAGLLAAAALGGLAVVLWRRQRTAFFWLLLVLATYAVVSNVVLPIGTIFAERLLYLPSVGACVLLGMMLAAVRERRLAVLLPAVLLAAWSARAVARNPVWHDELAFAEALVANAPESSHAHHVLGTLYGMLGRDEPALAEFERAVAIYPEDFNTLYNMGVVYKRRGQAAEALRCFGRAIALHPDYFLAWLATAQVANGQARYAEALEAAEHAVALGPDAAPAHVALGLAYRGLGRAADARAAFEDALRLDPQQPQARAALRDG